MVVLNPLARAKAAELGKRLASVGLISPIHCIPMVVDVLVLGQHLDEERTRIW